MMDINPVAALFGTASEDPAKLRADAEAAASKAAAAKREAQQNASKRRARAHNQHIAQLQNQARHEQHEFMAVQNAQYHSVAERNLALIRARASMMAAHIAMDLATSVPARPQQEAGIVNTDSRSIDTDA
ncbi:hypothetical protein PMM47T1_20998 [Pseudomonas sp. M47T1]|uniref:hypothetical protein n=1 Tax=unclassified Pseudomonas TaxID=196821 RepID=UPI000260761B|nr:hypothetical protein [Pseudomonas sp. M47T1]EIK94607.1 hypothetical protein PMM47T1_20998 [Pseudomonas sp. M47T1]